MTVATAIFSGCRVLRTLSTNVYGCGQGDHHPEHDGPGNDSTHWQPKPDPARCQAGEWRRGKAARPGEHFQAALAVVAINWFVCMHCCTHHRRVVVLVNARSPHDDQQRPCVMHRQANGAYGHSNGGAANGIGAPAGGAYGPPQPAYGAAASAGGAYGAPQPEVLQDSLSMAASACAVCALRTSSCRLQAPWHHCYRNAFSTGKLQLLVWETSEVFLPDDGHILMQANGPAYGPHGGGVGPYGGAGGGGGYGGGPAANGAYGGGTGGGGGYGSGGAGYGQPAPQYRCASLSGSGQASPFLLRSLIPSARQLLWDFEEHRYPLKACQRAWHHQTATQNEAPTRIAALTHIALAGPTTPRWRATRRRPSSRQLQT